MLAVQWTIEYSNKYTGNSNQNKIYGSYIFAEN